MCTHTQRKASISHGTTSPIYTRHNAPSTARMCCVDIFTYTCTPIYIHTYVHTMYSYMCTHTQRKASISHGTTSPIYTRHNAPSTARSCRRMPQVEILNTLLHCRGTCVDWVASKLMRNFTLVPVHAASTYCIYVCIHVYICVWTYAYLNIYSYIYYICVCVYTHCRTAPQSYCFSVYHKQ